MLKFPLIIVNNTDTEFLQKHFALIMDFFDVKTKYSKILLEVVLFSNPETQIIYLTKFSKKEIAKKLNYKNPQSIDSALTLLVQEGFLIRIAQSTFKLNNWLLLGVDWRNVVEINVVADYVPEGREIELSVKTNTNEVRTDNKFIPYHINPLRPSK